jgi:hypothetical protein
MLTTTDSLAASDTIRGLFAKLDAEPKMWAEICWLLVDAFLDVEDWEASEACRDIVDKKRVPYYWAGSYGWGRDNVEGENGHWPKETILPFGMVFQIDSTNGDNYTDTILPQLTGFILAWKEGLRP